MLDTSIDLHQPLQARDGLQILPAKLAQGEAVTIVYFGGSITQSGGYRGPATRYLQQRYPSATVTEVNAGIGGTASDLGAFRVDRDVLAYDPDLVLIEFAVNDAVFSPKRKPPTDKAVATNEGIVRRVRAAQPDCDICSVYTLAQHMLEGLNAGQLWHEAAMHERVAQHYGLPSINLAFDVTLRLADGEMQWDDFARDTCHPIETGYAVYGQTMVTAFTTLCNDADARGATTPVLPDPLTDARWHHASMTDVRTARADGEGVDNLPKGWSWTPMVNRGGWECFDGVITSDQPGAEIAFNFDGATVGLFLHIGPECGDIDFAIDDGEWQTRRVFDDHCTYWRPNYCVLVDDLSPGPHRLRLRVSTERDERSTGHVVRVAYILHA